MNPTGSDADTALVVGADHVQLAMPRGGEEAARANAKATGKVKRDIIRDCLNGENGRTKIEGWVPKWMAFPPSAYTERGGVGTVQRAQQQPARPPIEVLKVVIADLKTAFGRIDPTWGEANRIRRGAVDLRRRLRRPSSACPSWGQRP